MSCNVAQNAAQFNRTIIKNGEISICSGIVKMKNAFLLD